MGSACTCMVCVLQVYLGDFIGSTVAIKQSKDLTPKVQPRAASTASGPCRSVWCDAVCASGLWRADKRVPVAHRNPTSSGSTPCWLELMWCVYHQCICQLIGLSVMHDGLNPDGPPNIKASFILEYMAKGRPQHLTQHWVSLRYMPGNLDSIVYAEDTALELKFVVKATPPPPSPQLAMPTSVAKADASLPSADTAQRGLPLTLIGSGAAQRGAGDCPSALLPTADHPCRPEGPLLMHESAAGQAAM